MAFVAQTADGSTIRYVDGKRYLWLASLTAPIIPMVSVALYFASGGNPLTASFPLLYTSRPYQALRDFKGLPRLPSGYPGSFGLASIPWLWFKDMDPKLLQWAGGDIAKVNVDPKQKQKLFAKYVAGAA